VTTVAANLDKKHRQEYDKQFLALDLKKDKKIDSEELTAFLLRCGVQQPEAERRALVVVEHVSGSKDGAITKADWHHSNVAKLLSSDHLIERQYKKLDVDEDGFISCDDLMSIFEGASREEIQGIIHEIDIDQDGTVNFEEFRQAMQFKAAYPRDPPAV